MHTNPTSDSQNNLIKNLSALTDKIGAERTNEVLLTLSQESEYDSMASVVKLTASKHFSISVEEIISGSTHWHSQIRSLCFHILHKTVGIPVRRVGDLFSLKESATHRQIKAMQDVIDNPSIDKKLFQSYADINTQFLKAKQVRKENLEQKRQASQDITLTDPYTEIRSKIKTQLSKLNISIRDLAKNTQVPLTCISEFLKGNREIKTKYLLKIQKYLNLPTII